MLFCDILNTFELPLFPAKLDKRAGKVRQGSNHDFQNYSCCCSLPEVFQPKQLEARRKALFPKDLSATLTARPKFK
jgi:hypothetical protein